MGQRSAAKDCTSAATALQHCTIPAAGLTSRSEGVKTSWLNCKRPGTIGRTGVTQGAKTAAWREKHGQSKLGGTTLGVWQIGDNEAKSNREQGEVAGSRNARPPSDADAKAAQGPENARVELLALHHVRALVLHTPGRQRRLRAWHRSNQAGDLRAFKLAA